MLELTPGFTAIPNDFLDQIAPTLTTAQLRVALYIYRHTIGYQKISDAISYNQFTDGITTSDGRKLDVGAGVSRRSLPAALVSLERRGLISRSGGGIGTGAVRYTIVLRPAHVSPASVAVSKPKEPAPASQNFTEPQSAPAPQLQQTLPTFQPLPEEQLEQPGQKQTTPAPQIGQNVSAFEPAPGQILHPTKQTDSKIKPDRAAAVNFITQEIAGISTTQAEKLVFISTSNQRDISYIERLVGYVASVAGNPAAMLTTLIKTNQDRTTGANQPIQEAGAVRYMHRQTSPTSSPLPRRPQPPIDFSKPFYQHLIAQQNSSIASTSHPEGIE